MPSSTLSHGDVTQVPALLTMSVSSGGVRRTPGQRGRLQQHPRHQNRVIDYNTEHDTDHRATSPRIGQRSQSLSALQPAAVIQPRMAQLETLEAKMASIEVSLSSATPRRKKCLPLTSPSPRGFLGGPTTPIDQLEGLRNALRDKENIIRSLRGQNNTSGNINVINSNTNGTTRGYIPPGGKEVLTDQERRHLEDRLHRLKQDTENKRLAIKNLKLALDKLDITDNIDVRIQQAELEYQLGREELNLLTLLEESRSIQGRLDESTSPASSNRRHNNHLGTVHAVVTHMGGCARLLALEVKWSAEEPSFGTAVRSDGIYIEWSDRDSGLRKGDRVVEINGKLLITRTPSVADLTRLYSLCPNPAQLVILRGGSDDVLQVPMQGSEVAGLRSELGLVRERAEEAQRAKDGLRADNLRLTHRISYLEEQVSELLDTRRHRHHHSNKHQATDQQIRVVTTATAVHTNKNVTNINIGNGDMQVFQKGPQLTALVGGPARPPPPVRAPSSPCIAASDTYATDDELRTDSRRSTDIDEVRSSRRRPDSRSVKSLELDSSPYSSTNGYARPRKSLGNLDYTSEPVSSSGLRKRPTPPKKPVRLSLHRAQSLQSVDPSLGVVSSGSPAPGHGAESQGRKRTREKSISGLRWPQGALQVQMQRQAARWC